MFSKHRLRLVNAAIKGELPCTQKHGNPGTFSSGKGASSIKLENTSVISQRDRSGFRRDRLGSWAAFFLAQGRWVRFASLRTLDGPFHRRKVHPPEFRPR